MRSGEKGVTLVELIVVVALIFVILPILWDYINSAILDSANVNNKVMVQTTVNKLMNNIEQQVQEASNPLTETTTALHGVAESVDEAGDGVGGSITIKKPNDVSVTYTYDPEREVVTYNKNVKEGSSEVADSAEFDYIVKFDVVPLGSNVTSESGEVIMRVNGLKITIVGRIDSKSNYTLTNEYFTRNTI